MTPSDIQALHRHLTSAVTILEKAMATGSNTDIPSQRNPAHFRESGHLSHAGIAAVYELFDQGSSLEDVAKTMGISVRGAAGRRQAWLKSKS